MERDYSLLRPFDLEAANRGEGICWSTSAPPIIFIGMVFNNKNEAVIGNKNEEYITRIEVCYLRMAPLAWREGKPVYKGDLLYWFSNSRKEFVKFIAKEVREATFIYGECYFANSDLLGLPSEAAVVHAESLTWTPPAPPKVKREGWVNVYPGPAELCHVATVSNALRTKEQADEYAQLDRIACVKIEWEE